MEFIEQYRRHAQDALTRAQQSSGTEARAEWLRIGDEWMQLADARTAELRARITVEAARLFPQPRIGIKH